MLDFAKQSIDMAKVSMFHNLRTGSIIVDTLISTMIAYIFSTFFQFNVLKYINFSELFSYGEKSIYLTCTEGRNYNGKKIMDTSETFRSVLYYIKSNIKKNKIESLDKLSEYYTFEYEDYDDDASDRTKENNFKDTIYLVNQRKCFKIKTIESNDIYFKMTKSVEEIENKNAGREGGNKTSITHTLKISTTKHNISYLQTFVDKLHKDYNDMINKQFDNKQYVFMYEGMDSSYNTKFKSYPFETTCDISKVFFENKDNLMKKIDFFKNNKSWYEKKGKPYTLGICNYGLPGCGKTSFEKAICKYLNRHMIIVDISRIKYMQEADEIFFSETINNKIIPYDKRIYVFPDIDRMTELLYDTTYKEKNIEKMLNKYNSQINQDNNNIIKDLITKMSESNDLNFTKVSTKQESNFTPLNLSKLLNIIDGIPERTGQVIIMSANNIEKIDKALLRPGRIDCSIEFKKASFEISKQIIKTYFTKLKDTDLKTLKDKLQYKYTPAELFNLCYSCGSFETFVSTLSG